MKKSQEGEGETSKDGDSIHTVKRKRKRNSYAKASQKQ